MSSNQSWFSKQRSQSLIAIAMSASVHTAACIALAFILISGQGQMGQSLKMFLNSQEDAEDLTQLDLTIDPAPEAIEVAETRVQFTSMSTEVEFDAVPLEDYVGGGETIGDVASEVASAARASIKESSQESSGAPSKATFFGAEAHGNRFVFVIDSSGSMRGRRWEALCKELVRAVKSLSPDQDFFVIGFDAFEHPMFGLAPPKGKFLKAVPKNIKRLQYWLLSIEHGSNTFPASAVGMAMKLEPDGIFLLSDGEIKDSTLMDLRVWNRKKDEEGNLKVMIPIHTVLLHSEMGFVALETIARENGGSFTPVRAR